MTGQKNFVAFTTDHWTRTYIFIYYILRVYEGTVRNKERRSALCEANWHENEFYLFTPVKPRKIYIKMFMEKKYNK